VSGGGPLGPAAQRALLALAREALAAHFAGRPRPALPAEGALAQPGGAFVTLTRRADHDLRGCIGFIESGRTLAAVVADAAVAAATRDDRFPPVTAEELADVHIDISVMGPLEPIDPEDVEVGRHGLVVQHGSRRGLLLPQVPLEHGWDREEFLNWTCRKAGLPLDTWRKSGCSVQGFTAIVFGEAEVKD
jgi:AmmeMemoRadiSam system protein A